MSYGANSIHKQLRTELEDYIKSQYFGKSPILLSALSDRLDEEGLLYQKPYIESSPAYQSVSDGIQTTALPDWLKGFFTQLSENNLGVFPAPFVHQIQALETAWRGKDVLISTGTGSGKTECFLWPLLAKLAGEAHDTPDTWRRRGVRVMIMYPMNALVSDQVSRLRRLLGDTEGNFARIFRGICGADCRRPQFGMYTGRTPYPGENPDLQKDRKLERTLRRMTLPKTEAEKSFFATLTKEGKIPAKARMDVFLQGLHSNSHIPDAEDAELITRFEMQKCCPDILITNYSMLEYMLLRPRERAIWENTRAWLNLSPSNRLLFVIDEAHMYHGSAGGEVALLIRRLFHKLRISRDKVQFILTTASLPHCNDADDKAVMQFARDLTADDNDSDFCWLTGTPEVMVRKRDYDIPLTRFLSCMPDEFEKDDEARLDALNRFWSGIAGAETPFSSLETVSAWMYDRLTDYRPFFTLMKECRGTAVSLNELAERIFPDAQKEDAVSAVSVLLAVAPLARSQKGAVLFPARMHMLFRGIRGVYACANENCPEGHSDGQLKLGKIFLSNAPQNCSCGGSVYELYNDRRCGALFYKGYITLEKDEEFPEFTYLWPYPGSQMNAQTLRPDPGGQPDNRIQEIHLYFPANEEEEKSIKGTKDYPILPCYLDVYSGFIDFRDRDDTPVDKPGIRKLYYSISSAKKEPLKIKRRPDVLTFTMCPHCRNQLGKMQLTSFSTRGNQSFFNLIQSQFEAEPPAPGKTQNKERMPNEGRKVLLFSDSRQRAARLARDMSNASDNTAARQVYALAVREMETPKSKLTLDDLYGYFCLLAVRENVPLFQSEDPTKTENSFRRDCDKVRKEAERAARRHWDYQPELNISDAPPLMQESLLRLFCGGYNTLYDSAVSWLEPTSKALNKALWSLEDDGIVPTNEEFLELFNAWLLSVFDMSMALGATIADERRSEVRQLPYSPYGLDKDWTFPAVIRKIMNWKKDSPEMAAWRRAFDETFLDIGKRDNGSRFYVALSSVSPRLFDLTHTWYRCEICSEITPFLLRGKCPNCGNNRVHAMENRDYEALQFWRTPIENALAGQQIHVIDTEEHTAQISYRDQREDYWSKAEQYELRFQDLLQEDETPVDILSSTTTMEVGIDIGSLVAIGLRNIPPTRENYQQRAGRAGRRGSSLSTIVTFCEDGPHDAYYFKNPVPMLRGDPRKPWIDMHSEKLLQRHLAMVVFQEFLSHKRCSLDAIPAASFLDDCLEEFQQFVSEYVPPSNTALIPRNKEIKLPHFRKNLSESLIKLKKKRDLHPDLFGMIDNDSLMNHDPPEDAKKLLDALYEEGVIPTFSFPKDVVSAYISDASGKLLYQVQRGLNVAISEYAPGRSLVVDKQTYQIGGVYSPGSELRKGQLFTPARKYVQDGNYVKGILSCHCGWFGLAEESVERCPFCGDSELQKLKRDMLRPWGLAPRDASSISEAQLTEEYSSAQQPFYSTLPEEEKMRPVEHTAHIRMASLSNQRIIMLNQGPSRQGFIVCADCGASMPGNTLDILNKNKVGRPYRLPYKQGSVRVCRHSETVNVNLGYDFVTDMMVLEFYLDERRIDVVGHGGFWVNRAAQSLAEALRLAAKDELDVDFTELETGYRWRGNEKGVFIDVYLYDNLSSGAGYAASVAQEIQTILTKTRKLLSGCECESACHHCLKHYRNQQIHGMLDRHAALELLEWGVENAMASPVSFDKQVEELERLRGVLSMYQCDMQIEADRMFVHKERVKKSVLVYPAMWTEPMTDDCVCVSEAILKYAKPYAVQKIKDALE